ncbi:CLUMA_CG010130, isoform A [Clunio marinus]|uniref:CLUMA_CG010130, isoform A n=1 Tax=Clunio marinus TaxID=568069 RepID=A0A1J1ICP1_9DIPT|nr:CLUMA_CG010130, isoform A [Clunio marinus]
MPDNLKDFREWKTSERNCIYIAVVEEKWGSSTWGASNYAKLGYVFGEYEYSCIRTFMQVFGIPNIRRIFGTLFAEY